MKETKEIKIEIIISNKTENLEDKMSSSDLATKQGNKFIVYRNIESGIFSSGGDFQSTRKNIDEVLEKSKGIQYFIKDSGDYEKKIKKNTIRKRKYNADNIRKKVKVRFMKMLIYSINKRLKSAGSKKKFKPLTQKFIPLVTKKWNKTIFDLTFKEIFSQNLLGEKKMSNFELKNLNNNLSVLKYLENHHVVSEKLNYNGFKNMKFHEIFEEYLKSKEFEIEINRLKNNNENEKYISDYIIKANNLIEFFSN